MFTPGNYFYNGVGHVTVKYGEVLEIGFSGIRAKAEAELAKLQPRAMAIIRESPVFWKR